MREPNPLHRLNQSLVAIQRPPSEIGDHLLVLVSGAPRSGTTVTIQVLHECLKVAVVDHVVAATWGAPHVGAAISQHLFGHSLPFRSTGTSKFGATQSVRDAHEFSYFWNRFLQRGWRQEPDVSPTADTMADLIKDLRALVSVLGTTTVAKGIPAHWVLDPLLRQAPFVRLLVVCRSPEATVLSMLRAREFAGDGSTPTGPLPRRFSQLGDGLSPLESAALQYLLLTEQYEFLQRTYGRERVVTVPLRDLSNKVHEIRRWLGVEQRAESPAWLREASITPPERQRLAAEALSRAERLLRRHG